MDVLLLLDGGFHQRSLRLMLEADFKFFCCLSSWSVGCRERAICSHTCGSACCPQLPHGGRPILAPAAHRTHAEPTGLPEGPARRHHVTPVSSSGTCFVLKSDLPVPAPCNLTLTRCLMLTQPRFFLTAFARCVFTVTLPPTCLRRHTDVGVLSAVQGPVVLCNLLYQFLSFAHLDPLPKPCSQGSGLTLCFCLWFVTGYRLRLGKIGPGRQSTQLGG